MILQRVGVQTKLYFFVIFGRIYLFYLELIFYELFFGM
jgi:hypothetical protein